MPAVSRYLTSLLLWTFLPSFLSSMCLSLFYRVQPHRRPTLDANASPAKVAHENSRARKHADRVRIILVSAYLIWTIASTYVAQARGVDANYYTLLGIPRQVVEIDGSSALKSHWRKLARMYHPDKVGKQGEYTFVALRKGVETLENDSRRWAYERFGPDVSGWPKLVTNREFLVRGLQQCVGFYVVSLASLFAVSFFRRQDRAYNFWRYVLLALTFAVEVALAMRATPFPLVSTMFPRRLPYEHVALLRQLFISGSMALTQVAPLLSRDPDDSQLTPEERDAARVRADMDALGPVLQNLMNLANQAALESRILQQRELMPLMVVGAPKNETDEERRRRERDVKGAFKDRVKMTFEDLQLKNDEGQDGQAWREAVAKGRDRMRREFERQQAEGERQRRETAASVARTPQKNVQPQDIPLPPSPISPNRFDRVTRLPTPDPD